MINEDDVFEGLDEKIWSQETVNTVIAAKAGKRAQKGQTLNCYSLDLCGRENQEEQYNEDNLKTFVDSIYEKASQMEQPIRFQLAIRVNQAHWTAVDMEISSNSVQMLNVDAAGDETGNKAAEAIFQSLVSKYPNADETDNFRFTWLRPNYIGNTDKIQGIQYDDNNCSRFTLEHLFHLSNLDTFTSLRQHEAAFKSYSFDPKLKSFDADTMPREFAFLYRDTQSKTSFNSLPQGLKQQVINKRGETLEQSEARHTQTVEVNGVKKQTNQAIFNKKAGFNADVRRLSSQDNPADLVKNRDVLNALENNSFLQQSVISKQLVTRALIDEARKIKKSSSIHSPADLYRQFRDAWLLKDAQKKAGSNKEEEALDKLTRLRSLTNAHKEQLAKIKESFSAKNEDESENQSHPKPS